MTNTPSAGKPGAGELSRDELSRASRPLLLPEWEAVGAQERLKSSTVLVVGAGGLGCPVISSLAGAGVGGLSISDGDTVGLSNLHRQTLYATADLGRSKAEVAAARAQALNPHVRVAALPALTPQNAAALMAAHDLTVDCTDSFKARYLVNDACVAAGRRWVWGAAGGMEGMVSVFGPGLTLRSLFPDPYGAESCDSVGVLGPLTALIGALMAAEALKLLGGVGRTLEGTLLIHDLMSAGSRRITLRPAAQKPTPPP
ncbi:MAG: HesA/MoeB/ThiF family protein [Deinococcus sp.]